MTHDFTGPAAHGLGYDDDYAPTDPLGMTITTHPKIDLDLDPDRDQPDLPKPIHIGYWEIEGALCGDTSIDHTCIGGERREMTLRSMTARFNDATHETNCPWCYRPVCHRCLWVLRRVREVWDEQNRRVP